MNNLYLNQELEYAHTEILYTLGEIAEFRSRETGRHVARVSKTAERLAQMLGLDGDECSLIIIAASMHDVGKIAIPNAVLEKPGPLSGGEWRLM